MKMNNSIISRYNKPTNANNPSRSNKQQTTTVNTSNSMSQSLEQPTSQVSPSDFKLAKLLTQEERTQVLEKLNDNNSRFMWTYHFCPTSVIKESHPCKANYRLGLRLRPQPVVNEV